MGTGIMCGGTFTGLPYGVVLPVAGAAAWSVFGGSREASVENLAQPLKPHSSFGSPVYDADYMSVSGDSPTPSILQSQAFETVDMTFFTVALKTGSGNTARLITNLDGQNWITLYLSQTSLGLRPLYNNAGLGAAVTVDVSQWVLAVGRIDPTTTEIFDMTRGLHNSVAAPAGRAPSNSKALRFGGGYQISGVEGSGNDQAFGAIYNKRLSDAQITLCCERIRTLMAARDIIV